jgi:hypothetical protein
MIEPCRHPKSGPRECLGCFRKRDDAKPSADPLDRQSRVAQARDLSVPRSASGSSRNVPVSADSAAGTSRGAPVRSGLSAGAKRIRTAGPPEKGRPQPHLQGGSERQGGPACQLPAAIVFSSSISDSPLEEQGFELPVPPRTGRLFRTGPLPPVRATKLCRDR